MTLTLVSVDEVERKLESLLEKYMERMEFTSRYSDLPEFLTPIQAGKLLGMDHRTVKKMAINGELRHQKNGNAFLILKKDAIKYLFEINKK